MFREADVLKDFLNGYFSKKYTQQIHLELAKTEERFLKIKRVTRGYNIIVEESAQPPSALQLLLNASFTHLHQYAHFYNFQLMLKLCI